MIATTQTPPASHSLAARPANFTRTSPDLAARLRREGRYHWLPILWLLRHSDFAGEGMEHSGSFRFADHLYRGIPSGRGWFGRALDSLLLALPSSRSMRQRCFAARDAMAAAFQQHLAASGHNTTPFRLLTVPCGLPRDVRDFAAWVATTRRDALSQIHYTGLDLDPHVIAAAHEFLSGTALAESPLLVANALDPSAYPAEKPHFISSTGLGEFLDDAALATFYRNVFAALAPGGTFFTSAAARGLASAVLLEVFELRAHYRTAAHLEPLLQTQPWASLEFTRDRVGLQTFIRATKPV